MSIALCLLCQLASEVAVKRREKNLIQGAPVVFSFGRLVIEPRCHDAVDHDDRSCLKWRRERSAQGQQNVFASLAANAGSQLSCRDRVCGIVDGLSFVISDPCQRLVNPRMRPSAYADPSKSGEKR